MISVIGVVMGKHRGLVVTVPWLIEELEEENHRHERLDVVVREVKKIADDIGAKAVALAGRLPSVLLQNGYEQLPSPIVVGDMGAVYTVVAATHQALDAAGLDFHGVKIGVLGGYGFLGSRVVSALRKAGGEVIAIDPRIRQIGGDGTRSTRDPTELANCDAVVVLTARGEQVETAVEYMKPGAIWVDDTHPQLPRRVIAAIERKDGKVIKATLTLDGARFWPRLPKWDATWLPGCCVEAMVVAANGHGKIRDQAGFDLAADRLGFVAPEAKHKSEL